MVSQAWHRLVHGVSWRPIVGPGDESFFRDHDAVIATEVKGQGNRGNTFEVYTFGQPIATTTSLAEAKKAVEDVYGPLQWKRVSVPPNEVFHYYFGPTTEFTDPLTIYVVDSLPRL